MTRRITCYVVFVTLIWGAHTQNEENFRDNKFKSNMTRNDFSNLLSSLIKLNEQRVSVLQRLYKLEDYGVLSEVLRTGDRKPENGNGKPNNLFLIIMSKNKTDPSRRNIGFEVVDTVTSLDVRSKKVHPKLNYVLDPAGYISQNTYKENSIETMFGNIPKVHRPKKTLIIDDGSNKNTTIKKTLKHHKPAQRTEVRGDSNTLRAKKIKARKEKKNRNKNSKYEIVSNDSNDNITIEDAISNNNHKYKDQEDEHDRSSPFSKEYVEDGDISIKKSKVSNKYIIIKTPIKPTTTKSNLRMMSTVNSDHKNPEEKEDENDYGSPFSIEYVENGTNRKYTKIDSDVSIKVHGGNSPKPKKNTHSPKIRVQGDQHLKFNRSMYVLNNPDNKYTIIMAKLKTTTVNSANSENTKTDSDISTKKSKFYRIKPILNNHSNKYSTIKTVIRPSTKNELRIISTVNTDKTVSLSNNNQNYNSPSEIKGLEDENYYSSPFSKEYDENSPNPQNTKIDYFNLKINVQDKQPPDLNRSKSILEQDTTFSTPKTELTTTSAKKIINIVSTVNFDKASEDNHSINNPNLNMDLKDSKLKGEHTSKEIDHSYKFPSLSSQNDSGSKISEATKDMSSKNYNNYDYPKDVENDTNKDNPGKARDFPDGIDYGDEQSENNTYQGNENPSPPVMVSEDVNVKTTPPVKTDSPSHLNNVTENAKKETPKATKDLRIGNNSNVKHQKHKDHHGKEKSSGDFIINKKKGDEFSIIVTHLGKEKPQDIKQPDNLRVNTKEFDQPEGKPIARKAFQKCLNKKAKKLCCKSCISAYKNVCTRLKCTSKAKKALKKECKKSCEKTFKSSSSKYSDEDSDYSDIDYSDSDYSDSDSS